MKTTRFHLYILLALALLAGSCVAPSLSEAQSLFSQAVDADNRERLGGDGVEMDEIYPVEDESVRLDDNTRNNYRRVLDLLNEALQKEDKLRKAKLLGTAYVLRALTHLQLDDYVAAVTDAERAQRLFEESPELVTEGGRDLALAYAVGPMVGNAQLFAKLEDWRLNETEELPDVAEAQRIYDEIENHLYRESPTNMLASRIVEQLQAARTRVTNSDDTEVYLQNQLLAALVNWKRSLDVQNGMGRITGVFRDQPSTFALWQQRKDEVVAELGAELAGLLNLTGANDPSYLQWVNLIAQ